MNFFNLVVFSSFMIILAGCHQPNPHPETMDPIYSDLEKEKKNIDGAYSSEKKELEGLEQALREVKPQTGQIKYAQKRVSESKARIDKLYQQKLYLELRLQSRLEHVSKAYLIAFEKGLPWPDPKEYQVYKSQKGLETAPKAWSVGNRLEKAALPKKAAGEHGESESRGEEHH